MIRFNVTIPVIFTVEVRQPSLLTAPQLAKHSVVALVDSLLNDFGVQAAAHRMYETAGGGKLLNLDLGNDADIQVLVLEPEPEPETVVSYWLEKGSGENTYLLSLWENDVFTDTLGTFNFDQLIAMSQVNEGVRQAVKKFDDEMHDDAETHVRDEEPIEVHEGSGNVFADLGMPNPEGLLDYAGKLGSIITRLSALDANVKAIAQYVHSDIDTIKREVNRLFSRERAS